MSSSIQTSNPLQPSPWGVHCLLLDVGSRKLSLLIEVKSENLSGAPVAHACNPSYFGGRIQTLILGKEKKNRMTWKSKTKGFLLPSRYIRELGTSGSRL
jgi:hypothetical protein